MTAPSDKRAKATPSPERDERAVSPERGEQALGAFLASSLRPRKAATARPPAPTKRAKPRRTQEPPLPPVPMDVPRVRAPTLAWVISIALHALSVGVAGVLVARAASREPARTEPERVAMATAGDLPEIELPVMMEPSAVTGGREARRDDPAIEPTRSGAAPRPRPDEGRDGRGGTVEASAPALNLADRDDRIALTRDAQSRLDRSQVQRVRDGNARASLDDRRALTDPLEVTFVAFGSGTRKERREASDTSPSRGALHAGLPGVVGATAGAAPLQPGEGESPRDPGSSTPGGAFASPGAGVLHGPTGSDHRASADVANARPQVVEGRAANPANVAAKPRDNVDADQEVASAVASLLHASTAGGKDGQGPGGDKGAGAPASGGTSGPGSRAQALGHGTAGASDPDSLDARLSDYRRRVSAKIHPLWKDAFPRWAAMEGLQGRAIIHFVVQADGSVTGATVARPSGIPEFDENVRRAVLRAAPFPPIPANLPAPMSFHLPFDAQNPAVK